MKLKEFVRKSTPSWGGTERHKISWTSARDQEIIRLVAALKPERAAIIADRLGMKENTAYCAMNRLIEEARQFEMMDKQATLSLDLISSPKEDSKRYNLTPIPDLADLTRRIEKLEEEMRSLKLVSGQSTTGGENR